MASLCMAPDSTGLPADPDSVRAERCNACRVRSDRGAPIRGAGLSPRRYTPPPAPTWYRGPYHFQDSVCPLGASGVVPDVDPAGWWNRCAQHHPQLSADPVAWDCRSCAGDNDSVSCECRDLLMDLSVPDLPRCWDGVAGAAGGSGASRAEPDRTATLLERLGPHIGNEAPVRVLLLLGDFGVPALRSLLASRHCPVVL